MDPENKQQIPGAKPPAPNAPGALPVLENKTFLTHTMEEDVQKARSSGYVPAQPEAKKPFSQPIAPAIPPVPGVPTPPPANDPFRESLDQKPLERDQPFPLDANMPAGAGAEKKFQIYVPQKKRGGGIMTVVLIVVLLLLLGGGGFGYYWFFMRTAAPKAAAPTPPVTPEPVVAQPVAPEPPPAPTPQPAPEPTPTPPEQPVVIIEPATTTEPVVVTEPATSTPPVVTPPAPVVVTPPPAPAIPEPVAPTPLVAVDRTVVVAVSSLNDVDVFSKIAVENAKIADDKLVIRYLFELATDKEKRFLTQKETAALLSLTIPSGYWKQSTALEFIGYKNMGSFRYGFVSRIANKAAMQKVASSWEKTVIDNLKSLYVEKEAIKPVTIRFSSNTYLDFTKRYINLPAPDVSLDWAVSAKYFVIATSKDMIFATLDKTQTVQAQQSPVESQSSSTGQSSSSATTATSSVPSY